MASNVDFKLNYNNILDFKPEVPTTVIHTNIDTEIQNNSNATQALIQISNYRPSYTLNNFNVLLNVIDSVKQLLNDNIKDTLSTSDYKNFIDFTNTYDDNYLLNNANNINGNTLIESWDAANKTYNEIANLFDTFKSIYYTKDIELNDAIDIDNGLITKLTSLDSINTNKINYPALTIDTQINQVMSSYINVVTSYVNGFSEIIFDNNNSIENPSLKSLYDNLFSNISNTNNYDRNKHEKYIGTNIINSTLINAINKRSDMINTMKVSSSLNNNSDSINNYMNNYIDNTFNSVVEFNKSIVTSTIYKNDYINSLFEKNKIRNIYSLSFNS